MKDIRKPDFMTQLPSKGHLPIVEILIACLVFFVGSTISSFVQLPAMMVYFLGNREYQEMLFSGRVQMDKIMKMVMNLPQWVTVVMLVGELGLILSVFIYCRFLEKRKINTLGFRKKRCVLYYVKGMFLGMLLFGVAYLLCYVSGSISFVMADLSSGTILYVVAFFLGYMIQGMAEEVLCRGYLLVSLSRRCSVVLSVVLSSLFFSMLHGLNQGITLLACVNLFLFGVFMALLFIRCENIWIVGALHSMWNFVQGNVFGVQVSGMKSQPSLLLSNMTEGAELVNGGAFGMEGGLAVTVVLAAAIGIVLHSMKKHGYIVEAESQSQLREERNMPQYGSGEWQGGNIPPQNNALQGENMPPQNNALQGENMPPQENVQQGGNILPQNNAPQETTPSAQNAETQPATEKKQYVNMGLNPEETPWHPQEEEKTDGSAWTGFDQSYFKD